MCQDEGINFRYVSVVTGGVGSGDGGTIGETGPSPSEQEKKLIVASIIKKKFLISIV